MFDGKFRIFRGACSSLEAHLSAVTESRVHIPAPYKYYNEEAAETEQNKNGQRPQRKVRILRVLLVNNNADTSF